jgi:hypothetical protein
MKKTNQNEKIYWLLVIQKIYIVKLAYRGDILVHILDKAKTLLVPKGKYFFMTYRI